VTTALLQFEPNHGARLVPRLNWSLHLRAIRTFLACIALLASFASGAQAQAPACTGKNVLDELRASDPPAHARILAAAATTENAGAILWRIEKTGAPPSYLFGTMHLTDERINALSPAVKAALSGTNRLVLELDDLSPGGFVKLIAGSPQLVGLMMFTDGRRLDQLLGTDDFRKVGDILSRYGVPAGAAGQFRPWLATLLLAVSGCEQRRVGAGLLPLDARLAQDAEGRGIKALGLETLELQFRALASVPEADQIDMLRSGVRFYDRIDDLIETMVQLYLRRQLGAIWPLQLALAEKVGVPAKAFESAEQSLLITRNLGMRDKVLGYLADGNTFVAVGALHLPGRQGLVALLREAGYTLTAVE
jgi:uncharacterized protein